MNALSGKDSVAFCREAHTLFILAQLFLKVYFQI